MVKKIKSTRFGNEWEVETCKAGKSAVNPAEIEIVRFASLKQILRALEDCVRVNTSVSMSPPLVCVTATLEDENGVKVTTYGSVNVDMEDKIPTKFPVETAYSRAISNLVIEYMQFEGRVYADVAIPPDDENKSDIPQSEPVVKAETEPGEYVVQFGNASTKGKKIKELSEVTQKWLLGINATTAQAKEAQDMLKAYLG